MMKVVDLTAEESSEEESGGSYDKPLTALEVIQKELSECLQKEKVKFHELPFMDILSFGKLEDLPATHI